MKEARRRIVIQKKKGDSDIVDLIPLEARDSTCGMMDAELKYWTIGLVD